MGIINKNEKTTARRDRLGRSALLHAVALANSTGIASYRQIIQTVANLENRDDQAGRTLVRRVLTDLDSEGLLELRRRRPGGQVRSVFVDWNRLRGEQFGRYVRHLVRDLEIDTSDDATAQEMASACGVRPQTIQQWFSDDDRKIPVKYAGGLAGYVRNYGRAHMPAHFRNQLITEALDADGDSDGEEMGIGAAIFKVRTHFERRGRRLNQDELTGAVLCVVWAFRWLHLMVRCEESGLLGIQSVKVLRRLMPEHLEEIRADDTQLLEAFDWIGRRLYRRPGPSHSRLVARLFTQCEEIVEGGEHG
jgi:hypothetical protein